jgi:hypothetical protein
MVPIAACALGIGVARMDSEAACRDRELFTQVDCNVTAEYAGTRKEAGTCVDIYAC